MASRTETLLHDEASYPPQFGTYPSAAAQVFPKGTIVLRDAAGRAVSPATADVSGFPAQGIAKAYFINSVGSEAGGLADALDVEVAFGVFGFVFTGPTPIPGTPMFVVDNQTVSSDGAGGKGSAGLCVEVRQSSGGVAKAYVLMGPAVPRT
jgi:hypothetical protein